MNNTTPPTTRDSFDDDTIGAELLHAFAQPWTPFQDWMEIQLKILEVTRIAHRWERNADSKQIAIVEPDGKVRFKMFYAFSLAREFSSLTGAIMTISICENHGGGQINECNLVEAELERYRCLASFGDSSDPKLLHEYLGVDEKHQPWIQRQIAKFQMREDIDYVKGEPGNQTAHGSNMIITLRKAFEIAKDQDTRRAEQIRICADIEPDSNVFLRPGLDEMTEMLMAAQARTPRHPAKRKSATKSYRI